MTADDFIDKLNSPDPAALAELEAWVVETCAGIRAGGRPLPHSAEHPAEKCRITGPDEIVEKYLSGSEYAILLKAHAFCRTQRQILPDENPSPTSAALYLLSHTLYAVLSGYCTTVAFAMTFEKGLRAPKEGEKTFRIKNLLCEPDAEGMQEEMLNLSLMTALFRRLPRGIEAEAAFGALMRLFDTVIEIFYGLSAAVYSTPLVAECRRAHMLWRLHLGVSDTLERLEDYIRARRNLDAAILNGTAGRFEMIGTTLNQIAQEFVRLRGEVERLRTGQPALPETKPAESVRPGPHGHRKNIPVDYAAKAYGVSNATICNWDKGQGAVPINYHGRDVSLDEFNTAASADLLAMGHREGVINRVRSALSQRKLEIRR